MADPERDLPSRAFLRRRGVLRALAAAPLTGPGLARPALAQPSPFSGWATVWAASAQGPYPVGFTSAQPEQGRSLPDPAGGARDQSFRMVLSPGSWGPRLRLRFSNAFGTRALAIGDAWAGVQSGGAALLPGSNQPVRFGGGQRVSIPPGGEAWSDPVPLPFSDPPAPLLDGRKLAVSFHVAGPSGPMTWHATALQTSYLSAPGGGSLGEREDEGGFPFSTTSWFFLDAVDMQALPGLPVVVALGDSITDGVGATLNGDDRWPDVLARRLGAAQGGPVSVVNAGINGNRILGPEGYGPGAPWPGGPPGLERLERDVIRLSGVGCVIWALGINDLARGNGVAPETVLAGMREGARRLRAGLPGVRLVGATLTSALASTNPAHGGAEQDARRRAVNEAIRHAGLFDAVADFDRATLDPATGGLRPDMVPGSTVGGAGDGLHPNRAGYLAMAEAVPLDALLPAPLGRPVSPR
ncbi:GDSL-type esterase/lipase family protein [Roseomonas gilardii]|uniref:GDSL-type esterase/lipase family protein n=1 Tax=Roseomonas gilardii TaxID=257708 RepID=UPI00119E05B8|nr:GDSL-type esterase/lipase family protein [Roseomonas gilardii]